MGGVVATANHALYVTGTGKAVKAALAESKNLIRRAEGGQ